MTTDKHDDDRVITITELRDCLDDRTDMQRGEINKVIRNAREDSYNRVETNEYDLYTLKQLIENDFLTNAQLLHLTDLLNDEQRSEILNMIDIT